MQTTFTTTLLKDSEKNATGIPVPADAVSTLGAGKRPVVNVTINGFTYQSSVAVMGGEFFLPLSQERRAAAGVEAGDSLTVTLVLEEGPRLVEVPDDLAAALGAVEGARDAFDALSYSTRKEFVRQVESAKAQETRNRRIEGIVAKLGATGA